MAESPDELSRNPEPRAPEATSWTPSPPGPGPWGYPPPQPYYGFAPSPPPARDGLGPLVLGVIGLLFSWLPVGGLILGICAVAIGVASRRRAMRGQAAPDGRAIAGIVLGVAAIVIGGAITFFLLYLIISYQVCIGDATDRYQYSRC